MKKLFVSIVIGVVIFVSAAAAQAADQECFGTDVNPGVLNNAFIDGDLTIPVNNFCVLENSTTVTGNISVEPLAGLTVINSTVNGNLRIEEEAILSMSSSNVNGNVKTHGARIVDIGVMSGIDGNLKVHDSTSGVSCVGDSTVEGNAQLAKNLSNVNFNACTIGGNAEFVKNAGNVTLQGSDVAGTAEFVKNSGNITIIDNTNVGGIMRVFKNVGGTSLLIENNNIGGNLVCKKNDPAPTGGSNIAAEKKRQCKDL